jgi:hypothetical protein
MALNIYGHSLSVRSKREEGAQVPARDSPHEHLFFLVIMVRASKVAVASRSEFTFSTIEKQILRRGTLLTPRDVWHH